ncbi:MAG TPA: hypothetical protein GX505_00615 [Clostridiales bacterium]|nr:hypothetical protein [Clostridiales bacterium]
MKKLTASLLVLCLIMLPSAFTYADTMQASQQANVIENIVKDETIYANLDHDGSVSSIYVVNRLETPSEGIYTDIGSYTEITNLTNLAEPVVENDRITWKLSADPKGFYYQGAVAPGQGRLPFEISINYKLDGKSVKPDEIIGKSGRVEINIKAKPNAEAKKYFHDNFMLQIQVPISLDNNFNIQAPGSSTALVGRTATLAYMVMPRTEKEYTIQFDTAYFEMSGMTMTSTYININDFIDIDLDTDKLKDDVQQMSDGTGELIEGTQKLKDGLEELHAGIKKLSDGGKQIKGSSKKLKDGVSEYTSGVSQLAESAEEISSGLKQLAIEGLGLSNGFTQLKEGIVTLIAPFASSPMLPGNLKEQMLALQQQLTDFDEGLSQYANGIAAMSNGFSDYYQGISQLSQQKEKLVKGLSALSDGISQLAGGLSELSGKTESLPSNVQSLIDGQSALKDGIDQSMSLFDELEEELGLNSQVENKPVSFISDEVTPRTVQFIMQTPELRSENDDEPIDSQPEERKSFWEKLLDLFRF